MSRLFDGMEALLLARLWDNQLRHHGVTLAQVSLLDSLIDAPLRMGELARMERISHPVVNGLVARDAALGLVTKARGVEDGRTVIVGITRKGEKLLTRLADLEV